MPAKILINVQQMSIKATQCVSEVLLGIEKRLMCVLSCYIDIAVLVVEWLESLTTSKDASSV